MTTLLNRLQLKTATVVGQITHDRYDRLHPGGCAFFAAKTIAALGAKTSLLSAVGLDFQFDAQLEGIDRLFEIGAHTTTFTNVYPATGPRLQYVSARAPMISKTLLPKKWRFPDLMLLAPVMGELDGFSWRTVRDSAHVALFLQGFMKRDIDTVRSNRKLVVPLENAFNFDILNRVDSVFLSEEDIELFASSRFVDELVARVPIVAVTRGAQGSTLYHKGARTEVGIFPVKCIDPTGAGDTFGAATAMALAAGSDVETAGRLGAAAASVIVEGKGSERLNDIPLAWERESHISAETIPPSIPRTEWNDYSGCLSHQ
ncbi:MAG: hypothetical protein JXX29_21510 [Deltaproteobacteria bacterium]|nr:hypothetical protein [Deltaproteobacteria bacterium]MBN2674273.1 hypothetical protein [Deltaproteobacteria bacterium]